MLYIYVIMIHIRQRYFQIMAVVVFPVALNCDILLQFFPLAVLLECLVALQKDEEDHFSRV